jgi:hypothetical protein
MTTIPVTAEGLLELALRCEATTGPDTALDLEIRDALGLPWRADHLRYTASLDGAVTLVPEGAQWTLTVDGPRFLAHVSGFTATAATPALALCSAALRARASQEAK